MQLNEYIQSRYGTCQQAETEGRCDCLIKNSSRALCANWTAVKATNWDEMIEWAKKRYEVDGEKDEG